MKIKIDNLKKNLSKLEQELKEVEGKKEVKLNPEQRDFYESILRFCNDSDLGKKLYKKIPFKNEKDYLIHSIKTDIGVNEFFLKQAICEEKGHVEEIAGGGQSSNGPYRIWVTCKNCEAHYERPPTGEEQREWNKLLNTPMTI